LAGVHPAGRPGPRHVRRRWQCRARCGYSRKDTDDFGNFFIVERAYSKRAEFDLRLDTARVATVQRLLASLRTRPVVWIGEASYEATLVFGFFKDFSISISGPSISDGTLTVEGLV